jgi:hypothetical protein
MNARIYARTTDRPATGGKITKYQLSQLLFGKEPKLTLHNGKTGIVQGIWREDGSGNCFIVTVQFDDYTSQKVFIRTID